MAYIRHDSHGQTTIKNSQALGSASPLETDEDGYAEIGDDAADLLAALDTHVDVVSAPASAKDEDESDDEAGGTESDDGEAEDEGFDAEAFVDRTPMSEVIEDLESGDYDEHLDAIEAAEAENRDREGVTDAITARRE